MYLYRVELQAVVVSTDIASRWNAAKTESGWVSASTCVSFLFFFFAVFFFSSAGRVFFSAHACRVELVLFAFDMSHFCCNVLFLLLYHLDFFHRGIVNERMSAPCLRLLVAAHTQGASGEVYERGNDGRGAEPRHRNSDGAVMPSR